MPEPAHQDEHLRKPAHSPVTSSASSAQDPTVVTRPQVFPPSRPGAAMRERAINAPGTDTSTHVAQSIDSGAEHVVNLAQSLPAQMAGSGTAALAGGNPAELAAHMAILTQSAAKAVTRKDSGKQREAAKALKENQAAHAEIGLATKSKEVQKTGMVGDGVTWQEQLEKQATEPDSEATKLAQREQARHQHEDSIKTLPAEEQERARREYESQHGKMAATAKFVSANLNLGAANAAIGKDSIKEYTQAQTLGEVVPDEFAKLGHGHVLSEADRPQGTRLQKTGAFFNSMSRSSRRPLGNTATLTEAESAQHSDLEGKLDFLRGEAKSDLEARKQLPGGYHPHEAARKEALKTTIGNLEGKASAARSATSSLGGLWHSFSQSDQEDYDNHGAVITKIDADVKARREEKMAAHKATIAGIDAKAKENLSQRERHDWLSMSPGAYKFTEAEQKEHDHFSARIDALTKQNEVEPLDKYKSRQLANFRTMRDELVTQRDTGMTPEMTKARASAKASRESIKSNKSAGITKEEAAARSHAHAAREEMDTTLKTGLGKDDRDALAAAKAEREEQRTTKKKGLNKDSRDVKAELKRQQKEIYKDAASKEDFLARNAGHEVRNVNGTMRAGGINATGTASGNESKSTWGGMFAQAGRWIGEKTAFLGQLIKGSSSAAKAHLDAGDLASAASISAVGAAKESAAFAAGPGAGHGKHFVEGIGQATEGLGRAVADVSDTGAKHEDLADAQAAVDSGDRSALVANNAVGWMGQTEEKESGLGSKLGKDAWKMIKGAGTTYLATDQGSAQMESTVHAAKKWAGMNPDPAAPTSTVDIIKDKAETAGLAAVKSNADDLLTASGAPAKLGKAYKAISGSSAKGPKATPEQLRAMEKRYAGRDPEANAKQHADAFAALPTDDAVATESDMQARKASAKAASVLGLERKEDARYAARQAAAPAQEEPESMWGSISRGVGSMVSGVKGFFGW